MSDSLPKGWTSEPLRNVAQVVSGGTPSRYVPEFWENGEIPWVTPTDITGSCGRFLFEAREHISERGLKSCSAKLLPTGTLLMTSRATLGEVRIAACEVCTNQGFKSLIPFRGVDNRFLFYQIAQNKERYKGLGIGSTFLEVNKRDTESFEVLIAPEPQQRRIAEILSKLDEAIEQTEELIEKMQQVKAGLMQDLFTRGVTPDGHLRPTREQAPELYKESPLGWIPKEWEVKSLGVLAEIVSGVTLGAKIEIIDGIGVPYLRVANVQDGYFDLNEVKTVRVSQTQFEKLQLRHGDVLMNEGGDFDKLGRGSVWQEEIKPCIHQNHVFRVRPRNGQLRSFYLAFWSQSEAGKKYFVMNSKQSTNLASINSTQLNRFPVALPPSNEQERIEARLFAINGHVESFVQELAKLRQQKHGLMRDLLTGRVRVKTAETPPEAANA
jgi:type I restriction enzyme S subunit